MAVTNKDALTGDNALPIPTASDQAETSPKDVRVVDMYNSNEEVLMEEYEARLGTKCVVAVESNNIIDIMAGEDGGTPPSGIDNPINAPDFGLNKHGKEDDKNKNLGK